MICLEHSLSLLDIQNVATAKLEIFGLVLSVLKTLKQGSNLGHLFGIHDSENSESHGVFGYSLAFSVALS